MGVHLTTMDVYLLMKSSIQRFEFRPEEENKMSEVKVTFDIIQKVTPFNIRAILVQ